MNQKFNEQPSNQTIKDVIIEKFNQKDYEGAIKSMGDFIFSITEDEIEKGLHGRTLWIDSFSNNFVLVTALIHNVDIEEGDKKRFYEIVGEDYKNGEMEKLIEQIKFEIITGQKKDADLEDKKKIGKLFHELRRIIHK